MVLAQQAFNLSTILAALVPRGDLLSLVSGVFLYIVIIADVVMLLIPKQSSSLFSILNVVGILTALLCELSVNTGSALVTSAGVGGGSVHDLLTPKTFPNFMMEVVMCMCQVLAAGSATKPIVRNWGVVASIPAVLFLLLQFAR